MTEFKPAPEGQPTSSVMRFLEHSKGSLAEWEYEVASLKRKLAVAENAVERAKENVKRYEYQVALRVAQGRVED